MIVSLVSCGKKDSGSGTVTSGESSDSSAGTVTSGESAASSEEADKEASGDGHEYADYDLTGLHVLEKGFTDVKITDGASAAEAVSACNEAIGCKNALNELTPFVSFSLDGINYYRLQQRYKEIPVYGKHVVVAASDEGEALSMTTDAADIPEDLDLTPSITDLDVAEAVREYAIYQWQELSDVINIEGISDDKLVIYDMDEEAGVRLAYDLVVNNNGEYEVIVDAKTAEILTSVDHMYNATGTTADEKQSAPIEYDEELGGYYLYDKDSGIAIFDLCRHNFQKQEGYLEVLISKEDTIFGNTEEEKEREPEKAFRIMNNILYVHDYYLQNFNMGTPTGSLYIFYNDSNDKGNNSGATIYKGTAGICVGYNMTGGERDVLAHEYTHAVISSFHMPDIKNVEAGTLHEGLADVFGCFCDGDWDIDLTSIGRTHRNAADPAKYGYPDHIKGTYSANSEAKHAYATAISHAAYLMSESKAFTDQKLQKLWFESMISMPANCGFITFRSTMENMATVLNCSARQKQAIAAAFDAIGISYYEVAEKYNNDIALTVYDLQGNIYDDYTVKTYKLNKNASGKTKAATYSTTPDGVFNQGKPEPLQLHLEDGTYRIVISDNANSQKTKTYNVLTDSSSSKKEMPALDFGADHVVAPNAKLTVLDINGDPVTDYKASVIGSNNDRAITTGVIDLPEKNYYKVLLSHKEEGTMRMNLFTVRVKEGADNELVYKSSFISGSADTGNSDSDLADSENKESSSAPSEAEPEKEAETGKTSQVSENPYAKIVRGYESSYGKLSFEAANILTYYTGVFLIKLIDFDQDGTEELLIGYSTVPEELQDFITAPKLDVWTLRNGIPLQVYKGAIVHHGDIGSHCEFVNYDGHWCLVSGFDGGEIDISLLSFEDGDFHEYLSLQTDYTGMGYKINGSDTEEEKWLEIYRKIDDTAEKHYGCITDFCTDTEESLQTELSESYKLLGM